jgi:phage gpG-like protein
MAETFTLNGFANLLTEIIADLPMKQEQALEVASRIIQDEAKRVIGTYDYGWPQLADSTQADRVRKGFTPNDPLLRTGDLRDSIERNWDEREAYIGTNLAYAKYQELGTSRIPPRSFLMGATLTKEKEIVEITHRHFVAALVSR